MQNILAFVPHEDRAGRAAALTRELATRTGASVRLLRVLEEKLGSVPSRASCDSQESIRRLLAEVETQQLEEIASQLRNSGVDVSVEVCWGVPWEEILYRVRQHDIDLVVKPASGLGRRGRVFFGATALNLFRRCPCPVWVVGDNGRLPKRLLAAIDPSGATHRRLIASRILDWAEHVGEWSGAEIHIGTAWNAAGIEVLRERLGDEEWKEYVDETRRETFSDLERVLEERTPRAQAERVHLVHGVAHEVLPELVQKTEIDLVIMGTLGREGEVGDRLGETAETMIREVRSSVLTIPPGVRPETLS